MTCVGCGIFKDSPYCNNSVEIKSGITSFLAMSCSLLYFSVCNQHCVTWMSYLSMACVFTYILSFGMGPGKSFTGILQVTGSTAVVISTHFNQLDQHIHYI